jgi:class 3 adenylate cyclase/CHASE2 domain-containing sensor protein
VRLTGFGLGFLATLLVVMAKVSGLAVYEDLELRAFDALIRYRPRPPSRSDLVQVDIDDQAIEQVGRWQDWPRTHHAHLVETLSRLGARAVVFDIEFSDPSTPRVDEGSITTGFIAPLQERSEALRTETDDLVRQVRSRSSPTIGADEFADVLNQVSGIFANTAQTLQKSLAATVERPDEVLAGAMLSAGNVYLAFSLASSGSEGLSVRVTTEAVSRLQQDFTMSPAELGSSLGVPEEKLLSYMTDLREQAARTEAGLLLAGNADAPAEVLVQRLLGSGGASTALERLVRRAYDQMRSLRVIQAGSRTAMPERRAEGLPEGTGVLAPVSVLADAAKGLGVVNTALDADGKVRRSPLFWRFYGQLFPHLSLAVISDLVGVPLERIQVEPGVAVTLPGALLPGERRRRDVVIPVDEEGAALINWAVGFAGRGRGTAASASPAAYRGSSAELFPHVSAATVLELWDVEQVLEQNYLALDDLTGGRQAELRQARTGVTREGAEARPPGEVQAEAKGPPASGWRAPAPEESETQLEKVRAELREFLSRQVAATEARIQAAAGDEEKAELRQALEPLREHLQVIERAEGRRRQLLDYLSPVVKGSTCIIGTTFTGGTDFHPVPFSTQLPGSAVYGHVLNMVLQGLFLKRASVVAAVAAILICGLLAGLASATLRASGSGVLTLAIALAYVGVSYGFFTGQRLWLDTVGPAVTPLLAFSLVTAYRQLTEERQKRWIRNVFQHYLSPEVVSEVLEQPDLLGLRGKIQEVTVFFSDLANFTPIAEQLPPEELTDLLNDYLTPMTNIIQAHGGCLDKYEGDLIMGFFGAPVKWPDHARRACFAALENQARLAELREEFRQRGRPPLYARIGLATGPVRVGNMGSEMRFDYTVMGDYANLASRLEGTNKFYRTSILVSESTRRAAGDSICARELDLIRVKGRAEPVHVYEVLAKAGELDASWEPVLAAFAEGLRWYRERRWQEAGEEFRKALDLRPTDGPAAVLYARCREFLLQPPAADWDGVYAAPEK